MPKTSTSPTKGIMCCGCNRMMGADGKPIGLMKFDADRKPLGLTSEISSDAIAWFETNQQADEGAQHFGWRAEDANHRCPECVRAEEMVKQSAYAGMVSSHHGAYIDRSVIEMDSHASQIPEPFPETGTTKNKRSLA